MSGYREQSTNYELTIQRLRDAAIVDGVCLGPNRLLSEVLRLVESQAKEIEDLQQENAELHSQAWGAGGSEDDE